MEKIGPGCRTSDSSSKIRRVKSISDDVVFSMTSGRKKPSKHLKLGLAMKSLTGSKKVIELLNHYGHCASYTTIEELETELTFSSNSEQQITLLEMKQSPNYVLVLLSIILIVSSKHQVAKTLSTILFALRTSDKPKKVPMKQKYN